ncbi:MAG: ATP-binding protein [Bacteroidetes bacterium MED-G17]|nr:MAG: ATP-binding protein [Bacteroidetes bacterium MED-G17]
MLNALLIGLTTLWYTNKLVEKLAEEERKKVEVWANATKQILFGINDDLNSDFTLPLSIIQSNNTIPVIILNQNQTVSAFRNIDSSIIKDSALLSHEIREMKSKNEPITLELSDQEKIIIVYRNSLILRKLKSYPIVQLFVISIFMLISYLAFSYSRRSEQNQVWVGMSKETAHQLGTPISSLMAWTDMLENKRFDEEIVTEMKSDLQRLNTVVNRFSKIGSKPKLEDEDLIEIVENAIFYLSKRVSNKIKFNLEKYSEPLNVKVNKSLIEWVIENLTKNAVDAMQGEGMINISFGTSKKAFWIDFCDTGIGIPTSKHKTIFKPGYTNKERGWGLGLSLSKRIMNTYHNGDIFVLKSQLGKGACFRILLKN